MQHCQFCNRGHRYPSCPTRTTLRLTSAEHQLTIENPSSATALIDRLKTCMPVVGVTVMEKCYGKIDKKMLSTNFLLYSACEVMGARTGKIESLNYCTTFPGGDGNRAIGQTIIWIKGDIIAKLVHHNLKQIRFVFDETIHRKDGWRDREVVPFSQLSQLTIFG